VTRHRATIIGGGPAGLIAAEVLSAAGLSVTVYDHMRSVGRKFLLAGRGGLNLTHSEPFDQLLARYVGHADRLEPALRAFDPTALRAWCAELGEPTFVGTSGRIFPKSLRATPLLRAWLVRLVGSGVRFEVGHRWVGWDAQSGVAKFTRPDGSVVMSESDVTVFALGGGSWPRVGSDGGWVEVFRSAGVAVTDLRPSNCGVRVGWTTGFAERFGGVPLKNVAITVGDASSRGDAMVTTAGLEGGPIYAQSAAIRAALDRDGSCGTTVDLQPDLAVAAIRERLDRRRPKESLSTLLRRSVSLSPVAIGLLREATRNRLPSDSSALAVLVKAVPITVTATMPIDRAISSAGGISLDAVDDAFMLKHRPGTFVAGEMLDWEAPTGGYLLQASFSTGVAAAHGAIGWLSAPRVS
jgi:uncharacterized flavoprotein (TIGR03862 family)